MVKYFFSDPHKNPRSYPVIVFLHDDSFEWNSGNPYDGSVLASYGKVVVVTLNFRVGILGRFETLTHKIMCFFVLC